MQCVEELVLFQRSSPAVVEDCVVQLKLVKEKGSPVLRLLNTAIFVCILFCYMYQENVSESECEMASCSALTVTELSVKGLAVQH